MTQSPLGAIAAAGMPSSGLPAIGAQALPADVRAAGKDAQQQYRTALSFENVLMAQLTKTMQSTADPVLDPESDDDSAAAPSAAGGAYSQMLPGVMADALTAGGGIGIAREVYDALRTGRK